MQQNSSNSDQSPEGLWLCSQLGAREHYAVPRALNRLGLLAGLVTDIWMPTSNLLRKLLPARLRHRHHADLDDIMVRSWSLESVVHSQTRWRKLQLWDRIMAQNDWFERKAEPALGDFLEFRIDLRAVFSYSYVSESLFIKAKNNELTTILGQIDGGIVDSRRIEQLHVCLPNAGSAWSPAPARYWELWRRELDLADYVVVNSQWSRKCLLESGWVDDSRVRVIPLAYESPPEALAFSRDYPERFSSKRPMRCLFLGQVTLRKGILPLLEAMQRLRELPVELVVVGPIMIRIPDEVTRSPNIRFVGPVPRSEVGHFFREADVFVFPTYSDGFGLTQLEAQAWKLPIIASQFCGAVVTDGVNGIVLAQVSAAEMEAALRRCMGDPARLAQFADSVVDMSHYSIEELGRKLMKALR